MMINRKTARFIASLIEPGNINALAELVFSRFQVMCLPPVIDRQYVFHNRKLLGVVDISAENNSPVILVYSLEISCLINSINNAAYLEKHERFDNKIANKVFSDLSIPQIAYRMDTYFVKNRDEVIKFYKRNIDNGEVLLSWDEWNNYWPRIEPGFTNEQAIRQAIIRGREARKRMHC